MIHISKRLAALALAGILLFSVIPMVSAYGTDHSNVVTGAARSGGTGASAATMRHTNMSDYVGSQEALADLYQVQSYYADLLSTVTVASTAHKGEAVAELALNYVGCRYVPGGKSPRRGFDCSGFVYYIYKQFGYTLNPGARNQWRILDDSVSRDALQPGDLVFFGRRSITHVGIYIGDGLFVHAANSRQGVIVSSLSEDWYANRYYGAKRVFD